MPDTCFPGSHNAWDRRNLEEIREFHCESTERMTLNVPHHIQQPPIPCVGRFLLHLSRTLRICRASPSETSPARRAQLAKVDNRVIIGSAATTPESTPDWMEGAVAAVWQALKSLRDRAMRA